MSAHKLSARRRFKQSPIPVNLASSVRHAVNFIIYIIRISGILYACAGVLNVIAQREGADVLQDHEPWQNSMAKTTRAYGTTSNRPNTPSRPSVVRNNKNPLHLYNIPFGVDMTTILLFIIVVWMFDLYTILYNTIYFRYLYNRPSYCYIVLWWELLFRNKCFMHNIIVGVHL